MKFTYPEKSGTMIVEVWNKGRTRLTKEFKMEPEIKEEDIRSDLPLGEETPADTPEEITKEEVEEVLGKEESV